MKGIKNAVLHLDAYSVTQDFSRVKLNQNESPADIPPEIKEEVFERLKKMSWNRYPQAVPHSLLERIADYTNFPLPGILLGNASNELIQTVIYAVCDSGEGILTIQPGFSVYKRVAKIMNVGVSELPLKEDFSFDVGSIIEKGKKVKLVIFASPNNPTGTALKVEEIEEIARNIEGILAVDEAYYEFCEESAQRLISRYQNVIILRTFSKALHLAGIRLGYLLGREKMVRELSKARLPFSVGIFQQVAADVVLENRKFVEGRIREIIKERERVYRELEQFENIFPVPSLANFILFGSRKISGCDLYGLLYDQGIVLRFIDAPGLRNMVRVTIGRAEENDTFLDKLREVAKGRVL